MGFVKYFEGTFTCSGICSSSMFYYTLPMSQGPPTTTCLTHMKTVIADNLTYYGITATVSGIILVLTFLANYLLCKFE